MRKIISTTKAPKAFGAYSQGTIYKNLVFTSGQICLNPENSELKITLSNTKKEESELNIFTQEGSQDQLTIT